MSDSQLPATVEHDVFDLSEREDEDQILAELQGRSAEKLIYKFSSGGGTVEGLSYAGTRWAAREYSKHGEVLRIVGAPQLVVDPTNSEYVLVTAQAQRIAVDRETGKEIPLDNAYAVKRRWTKMRLKDGRVVEDGFYAEKCWGMAQRNALKALLPTSFVIEVIKRIKTGEYIPKGAPGAQQGASRPAPQQEPQYEGSYPQETPEGEPPQKEMSIRNMLFLNLKKIVRTEEACRAVLKDATWREKSHDVPDAVIQKLNVEVVKCFPGGSNELKFVADHWWIVDRATGKNVFPDGPGPAPKPESKKEDTKPAQSAPSSPGKKPDTSGLRQKFWVTLKAALKTKDDAKARAALLKLTGIEVLSDVPEDMLMKLGPILKGIVKEEVLTIEAGEKLFLTDKNKKVLWPEGGELPKSDTPPPAEPPASPADSEPMF